MEIPTLPGDQRLHDQVCFSSSSLFAFILCSTVQREETIRFGLTGGPTGWQNETNIYRQTDGQTNCSMYVTFSYFLDLRVERRDVKDEDLARLGFLEKQSRKKVLQFNKEQKVHPN